MLIRRGQMSATLKNTVDIRFLENRLRDVGLSRNEAKKMCAMVKQIDSLPDDELRDAASYCNPSLRDAGAEPSAIVEDLMSRIRKLT